MSSRDELLSLLEPPAEKWALLSTDQIVQSYGTALPEDYLWLMETYGPGEIAGDLNILPPVSSSEIWNVPGVCPPTGEPPEGAGLDPAYLEPGGLLTWGFTMNDDAAFWSTVGAPDGWPIVILRQFHPTLGPTWDRYECGIVEFLVRTFQGRLQRNPFSGPDLWRNESPSFARAGSRMTFE